MLVLSNPLPPPYPSFPFLSSFSRALSAALSFEPKGLYNAATVATLAKYQMVTIEKWYTACGGEHPKQAGPECDVEASMYQTFGEIKASKHLTYP